MKLLSKTLFQLRELLLKSLQLRYLNEKKKRFLKTMPVSSAEDG
jgi:hypothetical protein